MNYLLLQIISPTTLFLAAKVEEQPRKLEHVIKVSHACLNPQEAPLDTKSNVSLGTMGIVGFAILPVFVNGINTCFCVVWGVSPEGKLSLTVV